MEWWLVEEVNFEIFFEDRRWTVYVLMGIIEQKETGDA